MKFTLKKHGFGQKTLYDEGKKELPLELKYVEEFIRTKANVVRETESAIIFEATKKDLTFFVKQKRIEKEQEIAERARAYREETEARRNRVIAELDACGGKRIIASIAFNGLGYHLIDTENLIGIAPATYIQQNTWAVMKNRGYEENYGYKGVPDTIVAATEENLALLREAIDKDNRTNVADAEVTDDDPDRATLLNEYVKNGMNREEAEDFLDDQDIFQ